MTAERPKLIVIGGSLATGKTTVARALSERTGIRRVSLDGVKEALFDACGTRDRAWSKSIGRIAFSAFKEAVAMHLEHGESVIADATFTWADDADWLHEIADRFGAELIQIWMTADPRVARQRFLDRAATDRHCGHCDDLEHVLVEFDERYFNRTFIPLPLKARTLVVDTTDAGGIPHDAIQRHVSER